MSAINKALAEAQAEFPEIAKDKRNPHFNSKYVSLDAILSSTRPALTKHGLALSSRFLDHAVETILLHESGEQLSSGPVPLLVSKNDMQGLGSAITYARRYGAGAVLGISPDEDDDGNAAAAAKGAPPRRPAPPKEQKQPTSGKKVDIGESRTPEAMTALLAEWEAKFPIAGNIERWQAVYKRCLEATSANVAAGKWKSEECEALESVLDRISKQVK